MTEEEKIARNRWHIIVLVQILAAAGAVFGLLLAGRTPYWEHRLLGGAIVLTGMYLMYFLPKTLAHRWRTPPQE